MRRSTDPTPDTDTDGPVIEFLDGWVGAQYAADFLGMTRQGLHGLIKTGDVDALHVRAIRNSLTGETGRATYIVRETYLHDLKTAREGAARRAQLAAEAREQEDRDREERIAARAWARAQGRIVRLDLPMDPELIEEYRRFLKSSGKKVPAKKAPAKKAR